MLHLPIQRRIRRQRGIANSTVNAFITRDAGRVRPRLRDVACRRISRLTAAFPVMSHTAMVTEHRFASPQTNVTQKTKNVPYATIAYHCLPNLQLLPTPRHRPEQPQRASLVNVATMIVESVNASASTASWQWARRGTTTTASSTTGEHTSRNKLERTTHSEHQHDLVITAAGPPAKYSSIPAETPYAKRLRLSPPENRMTSRTRYRHIAAIHGSLHPGRSDEQQRQPRNLDPHQKRR